MNFIQKAALKIAGIDNSVIKAVNASIQKFNGANYFSSYGQYGPLANRDFNREYKNWVYACVTARAQDVANIKLTLKKNGELVADHEILSLLNAVNPSTTKQKLFYDTQAFLDLNGNAFWFLARDGKDGKGQIVEIYVLSPDRVTIVPDKDNPLIIAGYMFKSMQGQVLKFLPTEILHIKNFNPLAIHPLPHKGMGIVEAAAYAIDTDNEARKYNLNFFRNGARPDGILMTDGEGANDAPSHKRIQAEWEEEYQGSDNAHKVAVLEGGMKYQQVASSNTDMDFTNGRTFNRDEIMAMFKVPKSILGITSDVNRANAEATNYIFALRTIQPLMQTIVDSLNEFLLPLIDTSGAYELGFISPVPEDLAAQAAYYVSGFNKWLSRNDIRRAQGLPETPDGDNMYWETTLNTEEEPDVAPDPDSKQFKAAPVASKKTKTVKTTKDIVDALKEKKTAASDVVAKFIAALPKSKSQVAAETHNTMDDTTKENHIGDWKKLMAKTGPFKKSMVTFFSAQEKEVQKNLKAIVKGLKPAEYKLKAVAVDDLYDQDYAISSSISMITPYIQQWLDAGGAQGNTAAHGDGFDSSDTTVTNFIPTRAKFFADSVNGTTAEDLLDSIQEGIANSETLDQISTRVSDLYGIAKGSRTDMIARTEVSAASNFGSVQAYKQAGVTQHQWAVVDPEDDDCLENDGEIVDIGDSFSSGDTEPPVHPNCQCTTLPVFPEDNEEE